MTNKVILNCLNRIEGFKTRLAEMHWSAPSHSIHTIIDDFQGELNEYEDSLAENSIALWGFVEVGDLAPELPESRDFETLLEDIRGMLIEIKRESKDSLMWSGIINMTDDFFQTVNKFIYLIKIAKHEATKE